jgi:hypothetical protein
MSIQFGKTHPLLLTLDGGIHVIEGEILDGEEPYKLEDVILSALRGMEPSGESVAEITRLMRRILSPDTPEDEAFNIWHHNATRVRAFDSRRAGDNGRREEPVRRKSPACFL